MIMAETISNEILAGVGKKLRNGYLAGEVPAEKVVGNYRKNLKEASQFSMSTIQNDQGISPSVSSS